MTLFEFTVEEDVEHELADKIMADLEEVLGKYSMSLDEATWDYL